MSTEPESVILELLRQMRADLASKADLDSVRPEVAEMKSGLLSLRIDVPSDLSSSRKELSERIVGLRRAVVECHTSVIGHSVLVTEPEARVRRAAPQPALAGRR